jgi:hypothetical protein
MNAHQLFENAAFGPEALKVLYQAFDEAWASIAGNFGGDASAAEAARSRLASTVLAIARDGGSDPTAIKNAALQALALDYRAESKCGRGSK